MKTINVFHYDAFTNKPNKGNPAGIVLEADGLTEEEMQIIAEKVGYNETTFCSFLRSRRYKNALFYTWF